MMRAVFFDRDGVLNEVVEREGEPGSPRALSELVVTPGAADVIHRLRAAGLRAFVITNQPDIARGRVSAAAADAIMAAVLSVLPLDDALVCPHDDADGCACRKPQPGMIERLAARWGVDAHASWVVGDRWRDVEAGRAAGCRTVLLRRAYNAGVGADAVVENLEEAGDRILSDTVPSFRLPVPSGLPTPPDPSLSPPSFGSAALGCRLPVPGSGVMGLAGPGCNGSGMGK